MLASETTKMSVQYQQTLGGFSQEKPLDLTVKKNIENQNLNKTESEKTSFDFPEWYTTYLNIANRQYQYYPSYDSQGREITRQNMEERTKSRKRKQTGSSEGNGKVMKLDTDTKENIKYVSKERVKSSGLWLPTHQSFIPQRKTGKKSRKLVSSAIASINKLCDCRGCYEKHILKMRVGPWWECA